MSISIDINKPIPIRGGSSGRNGKYPWAEMNIGDSFLVANRQWAFGSLANYNKKMRERRKKQIKIETRTEGDNIRVWRIK
jgi:hypothetical protein